MATVEPAVTRPATGKWPRLLFPLGIAVYLGVAWYFGWEKVRDALLGADARLIAGAAAISVGATLARITKWRIALGRDAHAVGLFFLSRATGVWSPGRIGEFLPLLWKRHRNARVGGWILLDRVLEIVASLVLGIVGLGFTQLVTMPVYIGIAVATSVASFAGILLLARHDWMDAIARRFPEGSKLRYVADALTQTSIEIRALWRVTPGLLGVTFIAKVADLYAVVLIFAALGVKLGFMLTAASKCALSIVSFIPITPMATGVPHAVQGWMMNAEAGVPPEITVASVGIEAALMLIIFSTALLIASRAVRRAAI